MLQTILLMLIVLDPFGNIVLVNSLLQSRSPSERRRIILRETVVALVLLLLALMGRSIMSALGLQSYSLGIAGGIVLFMIAMGMIFPARRVLDGDEAEDPMIVPIAIPLIAGPGTISLVLLLAQQYSTLQVVAAVIAAWLPATVLLLLSPGIHAMLGARGSRAIERLTGMLLIMMSVQMVLDGVQDFTKR